MSTKKGGRYTIDGIPIRVRRMTKSKRNSTLERDGHKCLSCGRTDKLVIDHIIPLCKGGSNANDNLQTLCGKCNKKKGEQIIDYRKKRWITGTELTLK